MKEVPPMTTISMNSAGGPFRIGQQLIKVGL